MKNNLGLNNIDDEGIAYLHRFPSLKNLDLSDNKLTGEKVQIPSEATSSNLQILAINYFCSGEQR